VFGTNRLVSIDCCNYQIKCTEPSIADKFVNQVLLSYHCHINFRIVRLYYRENPQCHIKHELSEYRCPLF